MPHVRIDRPRRRDIWLALWAIVGELSGDAAIVKRQRLVIEIEIHRSRIFRYRQIIASKKMALGRAARRT